MKKAILISLLGLSFISISAFAQERANDGYMQLADWWWWQRSENHAIWCNNHPHKCHKEWCEHHPKACKDKWCMNHPAACRQKWCANHPAECNR